MSIWQAVTWNVARAGGFTAYILLTLAVIAGLALSSQWQFPRWPRLINNELRNFLTLLSTIFIVVHILAIWVDPFTHFGWVDVFIPFLSSYRPVWMALGIVALYLGLAIGISTWLRPRIGYSWWRRLHVLTLLAYAIVTVHGIGTGSDTQTWWGLSIYVVSIALVGGLLCRHLLVPANERSRPHPVLASLVGLTVLAGLLFTVAVPLRSGWNALTNSVHANSSLSQPKRSSAFQSSTASDPFGVPFTASLQGTLTQNGPDSNGAETLHVNTTLSNGIQGVLTLVLQGTQENFSGGGSGLSITSTQVMLGKDVTAPLYQGSLTDLRSGADRWRMSALLAKAGTTATQVHIQIEMQVNASGQVTGVIQGIPTQGSPIPPNTPATQQV
ncbi:MAG: hypothetical protein NVSMB33_11160 [Ktedonobacteraceae bacterium]